MKEYHSWSYGKKTKEYLKIRSWMDMKYKSYFRSKEEF